MNDSQAQSNYEAYTGLYQSDLERDHMDRVVLLHDSEIADIFDNEEDAYNYGLERFGPGQFSLQRIGAEPITLGIYSAFL